MNETQQMSFLIQQLAEKTAEKIFMEGGERVEVQHHVITKNNNMNRNGLSIAPSNSIISPQIYIDDYLSEIGAGNLSIDDAASNITNIYLHSNPREIDVPDINNRTARDNLYATIINMEANADLLDNVPHTIVAGDLAIVARFKVGDNASFLVKDNILPQLAMTHAECIEQAIDNTVAANQYQIQSMQETLKTIMGDDIPADMLDALAEEQGPPMIIVSNFNKTNGAVELFVNEDCRRDLYSMIQEEAYIIPSSIHEVIAIPVSLVDNPDNLTVMIGQINEGQVELDEQLGNHPYLMREDLSITIPTEILEAEDLADTMSEETAIHIRV